MSNFVLTFGKFPGDGCGSDHVAPKSNDIDRNTHPQSVLKSIVNAACGSSDPFGNADISAIAPSNKLVLGCLMSPFFVHVFPLSEDMSTPETVSRSGGHSPSAYVLVTHAPTLSVLSLLLLSSSFGLAESELSYLKLYSCQKGKIKSPFEALIG